MSTGNDKFLEQIAGIVKAKGAVPEGVDPFGFCKEILPLLGTTDGKLREWRVYGILHLWAVHRELSDDQLRELLWTIADEEHLFLGIGETESDTVYMRAFAVLVLCAFIQAHREKAYLASEELNRLAETVIRYLDAEQDLRGFVSQETQWAHATAHAADTFGELAQCEEIGTETLLAILDCLGRNIVIDQTVWRHEEDARAASAMIHALKRELLTDDQVKDWLTSLVPDARYDGELPSTHWRFVNARNLLRCLIHQSEAEELPEPLIAFVRDAHGRLPTT
ncbi:MAG: DUF2785 domain-containing protein [Candidatus Bipolaricaulia bacterium]